MTTAMILCAGLGTRLRPITDEMPKPLVWFGNKPLLFHILDRLAAAGVERVVLNTHHLAERFERRLFLGAPIGVTLVHEPKILGTAGGVAAAAPALGPGDVLVWNGDILATFSVTALEGAHARAKAKGAIATLAVAFRDPEKMRVGEGTVGLGEDGSIVRLRGETFGREVRGADFVGVQILGEVARARLPSEGCLVGDVYLPALRAGERVAASAIVSRFCDLGTPHAYFEESMHWLAEFGSWRGEDVHVDPEVSLASVILGDGVTVRGRGELREVVACPGAAVEAPLERAIVLGSGTIVRV
ncbi:sugar phosphate nucleotidyltransferase [Polyangium sp. 15x6]|uniref:nucleotidyltransferase family protein n=1 Tax=Polyangium sp. 15x6 TaxID=3042687 RepID=UPI00249C094B|nr:sugar phosphate nucleotidyltransferase [Polyangium sp. 15x6]MDI3287539.1 sugar phosphate nucleotidyltransferase [Polyangium sp. 15x6]